MFTIQIENVEGIFEGVPTLNHLLSRFGIHCIPVSIQRLIKRNRAYRGYQVPRQSIPYIYDPVTTEVRPNQQLKPCFVSFLSWLPVLELTSCRKNPSGLRSDKPFTTLKAVIQLPRCFLLSKERDLSHKAVDRMIPHPSTILVANLCTHSRQAASFLKKRDQA